MFVCSSVRQKDFFAQSTNVTRVGSEQYLAGNIDGGQKITEV